MSKDKTPARCPERDTDEYELLKNYQNEIKVILHTVNDKEYKAATTYLSAPDIEGGSFKNATVSTRINIVLGTFAEKKVALIQTEQGSKIREDITEAIEMFPNAIWILGIGVCYAMDDQKFKLGDVLISNQIHVFENSKSKPDGKIEQRGPTTDIIPRLLKIFCKNTENPDPLLVAGKRSFKFKASPGSFASDTRLINCLEEKKKIQRAVQGTAIGGEMEGGELLKFIGKGNIKGIIIIKGVADYADGEKSKEWQFTAAMSAFKYAESKLSNETNLDDEDM